MMRISGALLAVLVGCSPTLALDTSKLPPSCQDAIATIQGDKAQYHQLSVVMARSRKASDNANFCAAAKGTLSLIVAESAKVDYCLGDLANDKTTPQATTSELLQVKSTFRQMLEAAKNPQNDRLHCGLAG